MDKVKNKSEADICCDKGDIFRKKGNPNQAVAFYEQALELDENFARAYASLGDICTQYGQYDDAIDYYTSAIHCEPNNLEYALKIAPLLERRVPSHYNSDLASLISKILKVGGLRHSYSFGIWYYLFKLDPAMKDLLESSEHNDYKRFCEVLVRSNQLKKFIDPFFLWGLRRIFVGSITFENFIVFLRRYFLLKPHDISIDLNESELVDVLSSIATYGYRTEYIFEVSKEEKDTIDKIALRQPHSLLDILYLSCYLRISTLPQMHDNIEKLCLRSDNEYMREFFDVHISRDKKIHTYKSNISALTEIDDGISQKVKEQYEDFPYPQWTAYINYIRDQELESPFKNKKIKILVAGCGTGREAIEHAICFPDADVTAVDLSLSSLAYAEMKADEIGVQNISFYQADILKLENLQERFDYISSSGVIHHMEKPEKALKIFDSLLKDGGLLRLGIYSRYARRYVMSTREKIRSLNIPDTAEGIISFRSQGKNSLDVETYQGICGFRDYFILSECRDLLFNVQEHCLDLQQIKEMLSQTHLEFSKFYLEPDVINSFKATNKGRNVTKDLDLWARFEEKHLDTFRGMYAFWCIKRKE